MTELPEYKYRGARALVQLHEQHLREFLKTWREAKAAGVQLAKVEDPDYRNLDHLLRHLLRAARGYMTWMCEKLDLTEPGIEKTPEVDTIEFEADRYLEHVLDKWRAPLADINIEDFEQLHTSRWGMDYLIESMLEHAVVHPMRHTFQLRDLMAAK